MSNNKLTGTENFQFDTVVEPKNRLFDLNLKELWRYRDLILLFVKRNFISQYKLTVLGPAWAVIQPLLTTVVFTIIFGNVAGLAPGGVNSFVYYLCGTIFWQYFASCLTMVSHTFTGNSHIFGKVYFPRMVLPVSTVITNLISLGIQFFFFIVAWVIFMFVPGYTMNPGWQIIFLPLMLVELALLALGCGIVISALTTKYRDLAMLVSFGVQLWMYASPVAYAADMFAGSKIEFIYWLNPVCPVIETIRYDFLGSAAAQFRPVMWGISWITTFIILCVGVLLFSKVEKTFMDTV
ncbi:MAG: ABC transporter permease [Clostridia bacterium]|nr:ABC transporter permease [Clostridia bacterium]